MGVIFNAKLARLDNTYPVMIYSHGLGSTMNLQASLCKDLASKGVIVIAPHHRDEIYLQNSFKNHGCLTDFLANMNKSVDYRKQYIGHIIDYVLSPSKELLKTLVNAEELTCHFEVRRQIMICGHSYGGLTALLTSLEDPRIHTTIVLDPVMNVFDNNSDLLKKVYSKPFLILCSDNFH